MKKSIKITILISSLCVVLGAALFFIGIAANGFTLSGLNQPNVKSFEYSFDASEINSVTVNSSIADVRIARGTSNDTVDVVIVQDGEMAFGAVMHDGALQVLSGDVPWYFSFGSIFADMSVTVYLPRDAEVSLNISSDTGDISVDGVSSFTTADLKSATGDIRFVSDASGALRVDSDTGDIFISAAARTISAKTDMGEITLSSAVAAEMIDCATDTGDIELEGCDAPALYFETSTGDVEGTLYSGKQFVADSATGDVEVPRSSASGGVCTIKTSTGDIDIKITENQ